MFIKMNFKIKIVNKLQTYNNSCISTIQFHSSSESKYFERSLSDDAKLWSACLSFNARSIIISVEFQRVLTSGISSSSERSVAIHCYLKCSRCWDDDWTFITNLQSLIFDNKINVKIKNYLIKFN